MDADLSHPPEALPRILEAGSHADVVIGSRRVGEGRITGRSRWRNALTILGAVYARAFLRLPVRDCTGGYRLIRVAQLRDVSFDDIRSCGYAYIIEVNHALNRLGATFAEVPIVFRDRTVGESKISFRIIIEAFMVVPKLRFGFVSTATHRRSEPAVGSTEQIVLVGRVGTQPVRTRDDRSHPALQELPL
jgi:dolichol-phosphate mannosyltransferase